jgi:hypothetical protein
MSTLPEYGLMSAPITLWLYAEGAATSNVAGLEKPRSMICSK